MILTVMETAAAGSISLFCLMLSSPEQILRQPLFVHLAGQYEFVRLVLNNRQYLITFFLILIVVAVVLKNSTMFLTIGLGRLVAEKMSYELATTFFTDVMRRPYVWFLFENTARLQTEFGWRTMVGEFFIESMRFTSNLFIIGILLLVSFILVPVSSVVVFLSTGIFFVLFLKVIHKRIIARSRFVRDVEIAANNLSLATFQGMREVHVYQQQEAFVNTFNDCYRRRAKSVAILDILGHSPSLLLEMCGMFMLLFSHFLLITIGYSLAEIILSLSLLAGISWRILPAFQKAGTAFGEAQKRVPYVEKILSRITPQEARALPPVSLPVTFNHSVAFDNVSYSYPGKDTPAVKAVSLSFEKGQIVGFIGKSGAGKSTLIGLLTGLYAPVCGKVLIDGDVLRPETMAAWRHKLGYVPQSPYLLDATVADNIAFGDFGENPDRDRVHACCKQASIDFLDELEQGIDTWIGERGVRLSGGQAQRISIARALYREPEILIFDEATSNLDKHSEEAIQQTILSLRNRVTLVLIAHRLSTVRGCDKIFWIDDGCLRETGDPAEIIPEYVK